MLRTIVTIIYIIVCICLVCIVLMQEGKTRGLGALTGANDTYWSKAKGRSKEGRLVTYTKILSVLFIVLSIVLNMHPWLKG